MKNFFRFLLFCLLWTSSNSLICQPSESFERKLATLLASQQTSQEHCVDLFMQFVRTSHLDSKELGKQIAYFITTVSTHFSDRTIAQNQTMSSAAQLHVRQKYEKQLVAATRLKLIAERDRLVQQQALLLGEQEIAENKKLVTRINNALGKLEQQAKKKKRPWYKRLIKPVATLVAAGLLVWYIRRGGVGQGKPSKTNKRVMRFTTGTDDHIQLYDGVTGQAVWDNPVALNAHYVRWSPNGSYFTFGTDAQTVLYDVTTNREVWNEPLAVDARSIEWSPDGTYFIVSAVDAVRPSEFETQLYEAATGEAVWDNPIAGEAQSVMWSPDGKRFTANIGDFIFGEIDEIELYNAATGQTIGNPIQGDAKYVSWSPGGTRFTTGRDKQIQLYDAVTGDAIWDEPIVGRRIIGDGIKVVSWLPDGNRFITGTEKEIQLYDGATGEALWDIPITGHAALVKWSSDGTHFIVMQGGAAQSAVQLYDVTGKLLWDSDASRDAGSVRFVSWSPDGKHFILGGAGQVQLHDEAGRLIWDKSIPGRSWHVKWSPDGARFTAGANIQTQLYNTQTGEAIWGNPILSNASSVKWSPDSTRFTVGTNREIQLYDAKIGKPIWGNPIRGNADYVKWSPQETFE